MTPDALDVLNRILGGQLNSVLMSPPTAPVLSEVERLGIAALEYHSERRLRSAALL